MKNLVLLTGVFILLNYSNLNAQDLAEKDNSPAKNSISILCNSELIDLTTKWANEYCRITPGYKIKVLSLKDSGRTIKYGSEKYLKFVTNNYFSEHKIEPLTRVTVGRDVIVPVINSDNPFINELKTQGIALEKLALITGVKENQNWGILLNNRNITPVHFYFTKDESVNSVVKGFLNTSEAINGAIVMESAKEMLEAIKKDAYAIGFCRLINIVDANNQCITDKISILPIDKNGNGRLDYMEKIYDDLTSFSRGVWIGKYPKALFRNIYSVSFSQPANETEVAFLKWIITDGQVYLNSYGYYNLSYSERQSQTDILNDSIFNDYQPKNTFANLKFFLVIFGSVIIAGFLVNMAYTYRKHRRMPAYVPAFVNLVALNEDKIKVPKGLYYDITHTWAFMNENGIVKIGIDDFIQHVTGKLTRIEMRKPGEKINKGERLCTIVQKGKQLNIYSPVSGTIIEQNGSLNSDASIINSAPYTGGWIYMIEPSNWVRELLFLINADKYKELLKNEFVRLKDFFAVVIKPGTPDFAHVTMQDGGELQDSVLSDIGPEVWEEFQTGFINKSR